MTKPFTTEQEVDLADVRLQVVGAESASLSIRLVCDALAARSGATQALVELFPDLLNPELPGSVDELFPNLVDLLVTETIECSAGGALELLVKPVDRYRDFVSAVALCCDVPCDVDAHGWPILSMVCRNTIVADAGGVASASGGGGIAHSTVPPAPA